ncbi:MAG: response regulator [Nitrososphaerales archaeon]
MERISVLIVDDHRLFRDGLASLLASEPIFQVVGKAATAREALALLVEKRPDVALVDLKMPDTPGIEVIAQLLSERPDLGIVVLTASEENADLIAAIRAGARGYALKNVEADSLFDVIRQVHAGGAALCHQATPKAIDILRGMQDDSALDAGLTPREHEVVALIAAGADNAAIADRLVISENTVKTHVSHIMDKLSVKNRSDLIAWAQQRGRSMNRVRLEKSSQS